jgi:pyridoxal phosphate enzyme (YggS family)
MSNVTRNVERILSSLPDGVVVVAAIKGRTVAQMREAVAAGIHVLGANYVGDARQARDAFADRIQCHFMGRLRAHDIRRSTIELFDMFQSVGSLELAERLDARAGEREAPMPVLIEVNSGREPQKGGVFPEDTQKLVHAVGRLEHLSVQGLMTMGPLCDNPDDYSRPFAETRRLFEMIRAEEPGRVVMRYLSMGMSDSYQVAIDEGANMVRIGTAIFGQRG